ncbi:hypothetical protein BDQ17DRAFT_656459 [Cyathus striatus]|nr:hypothetical protein BDQ17DRAFT_656459 [Cyathus striatus]
MPLTWMFSMDLRNLGESLLLLTSLLYVAFCIPRTSATPGSFVRAIDPNRSLSKELEVLCLVSFVYMIWTHSTFGSLTLTTTQQDPSIIAYPTAPSPGLSSPRSMESKRNTTVVFSNKANFGYVWMSVPKNYRESRDDGIFTALLLGPLIVSALLVSSLQHNGSSPDGLPTDWLIEKPSELRNPRASITPAHSLLLSRYALVNLGTYCSAILLFHVCASWWLEGRYRKKASVPDGERSSVPRSEGRRAWFYILFSVVVSLGSLSMKIILGRQSSGIWLIASLFYQFALYMALRLAHRGFTLGELGLVCFGGTAICLEFLNLTIARIWPVTTAFIRTYRLPTPLLIFQISLIVGSFLTGFLLSPFLVLSRNIAQRPVHRLRFPQQKDRNRRYYALGFYGGTVLIVGVLIGMWTRWCLGNRDPWLWTVFWLVEGRRKWSRPALLCYWASLCSLSVAGWNRQLSRSRKYRPRTTATDNGALPGPLEPVTVPTSSSSTPPQTSITDLPSSRVCNPSSSMARELLE